MTEIAIKIVNQVIQLPDPRPRLVAGSVGVYAVTLAYDAQWDNASVRVVVFDGGLCNARISVQDTTGTVTIPPECIAHGEHGNWLRIGVLGFDGTGALRITTCAMRDGLRIDPAGVSDADVPQNPPPATPGLWEQLVTDIGNLSDLQTVDKSSLVAAINELAAKTGSDGMELRVADGYIQYSTDGEAWENLIAVADLKGEAGPQGETGPQGEAGPQGPTGPQGPKGDPGSDASVTQESIANALGYTAADAGKMLGIGEDGSAGPVERELFICTITGSGTADSPYACDKTTEAIVQAKNAGKIVYAYDGAIFYPATVVNNAAVRFEVLNGTNDMGYMLLANGLMSKINVKLQADNRVTSLSATSTDTQYPSAKCVYDELEKKQGKPEIYEATFSPGDWSMNGSGYYEQSVTIEGLKRDYILPPDIDIKLSGTDASLDAQLLAGWALVSLAQVDNNTLVLQCVGDPPASLDIPVIVRVWQ